jgi:hypothetical protein
MATASPVATMQLRNSQSGGYIVRSRRANINSVARPGLSPFFAAQNSHFGSASPVSRNSGRRQFSQLWQL